MTNLERYIRENGIQTPVVFEIGLDKINNKGTQCRYLRFFLNEHEVTRMVADALDSKVSTAKDTYGCIIRHGCGMDIALGTIWSLQKTVKEPNFYSTEYKYLGKKKKGKYEYK